MSYDKQPDEQGLAIFNPRNQSEGPIHQFFGLTYSSYLVLPRLLLQEMPLEWQQQLVDLLDKLNDTGISTPVYAVQRRDNQGRMIKDEPWSRYRHGTVADAIAEDRVLKKLGQ
jgi:hypothetical protein